MIRTLASVFLAAVLSGAVMAAAGPSADPIPPALLPPAAATGIRFDTVLFGGFAGGSFGEAVQRLGDGLDPERVLVAQHLERIFAEIIPELDLGRSARLRVALVGMTGLTTGPHFTMRSGAGASRSTRCGFPWAHLSIRTSVAMRIGRMHVVGWGRYSLVHQRSRKRDGKLTSRLLGGHPPGTFCLVIFAVTRTSSRYGRHEPSA